MQAYRIFLIMKIVVAKTAGFCMGVRRAVDLAIDTSRKKEGTIFTLGPLIHNQQTIDMLKERRVVPLTGDGPSQKSTILVRAHGIPPETEKRYRAQEHEIIDGTCPKVKTVHKVIEKYRNAGYSIIIAGDKDHAEVVGLQGYAGKSGFLVQSVQDLETLPALEKICLVSQTTFDKSAFDQIAEKVKAKFAGCEVVIKKTICAATDQRQSETQELAAKVDAMIVVGGKNSANTLRLANISRQYGKPVQLIEMEKEIDFPAIANCGTVGVTAGASTPNWMIKRVVDYLQFMDQTQRHSAATYLHHALDVLVNVNIITSIGAAAAYYCSIVLQHVVLDTTRYYYGAMICFLYFLAMYLWNSLANIETTRHLEISRYRFYNKHKPPLFILSGVSIVALLIISFSISIPLFYLMLFSTIAGSLYHITIVPPPLRKITRYSNLRDVPASRDLFVALAWSILITFIPQVMAGKFVLSTGTIFIFFWVFILTFLRSVISDLRDIEGDRIMGRETLVTIVGEKRARRGLVLMVQCAMAAVIAYSTMLFFFDRPRFATMDAGFLYQVPVMICLYLFVKFGSRMRLNAPAMFSLLADAPVFLAGFAAWIASLTLPVH